jgi:ribosomal protein S18 acetylase RimI-like enzyme
MVELITIGSGPALEEIRALFREYGESLNFSLCFQSFERELLELPGDYALPRGRLILAQVDGNAAGCIALKPLDSQYCEMKRLYVRPAFRGRQLGVALVTHVIDEARHSGYTAMRLDTIRGVMDQAIALYQSLGFREIQPYYSNPIPDAIYLELAL